ncbi:MAG TPA: hypothetical protein VND68_05620 [Chloroflexia bacterium]|jgi:hypothetical protein|nr:hypothetical protein [Chloroflexia bacterium]
MKDSLRIRLKMHRGFNSDSDSDPDYLVAEVLVNGTPLADFSYYATDLHSLLGSTQDSGEFFIITCWCGDPGCAGLRRGIEVRRESKVVYWHVLQPRPERRFVFEREAYDEAINNVAMECNRWLTKRRFVQADADPIAVVPNFNRAFFDLTPER